MIAQLRTLVGVTRPKLLHSRLCFIVAAQNLKWSGHGLTGPTGSYVYVSTCRETKDTASGPNPSTISIYDCIVYG